MKKSFNSILTIQKEFFKTQKTKDINFRLQSLKKLKSVVKKNENEIISVLKKDLGKCEFESYVTEFALFYEEINLHIKNLRKWSKPQSIPSPIQHFPNKNYIYKEPYGVVLIIGPFNYPVQLILVPLVGAISAGNCAIIKPSENALHTALLLEKIINEHFEEDYIQVVAPDQGKKAVTELINLTFDYMFFTGSTAVGKIIMQAAAKNLIPVTLELGGKSPCIVDKDCKLKLSAKRIVWGKFMNAGQTCIAPDYLIVHKKIKDKFLSFLVEEIKSQYGTDIKNNPEYHRMINKEHTERVLKYLKNGAIYYGGDYDIENKYIEPTILTDVKENDPVMEEEIFGPIFPVIEFENLDEVIDFINSKTSKPLALYYFSEDKNNIKKVLKNISSGGVSINDTIIQVAQNILPFGGVGNSGIGNYHGKASFETFSHTKSVCKRGTFMEFNTRFAPFKDKVNLIRKFVK